MVQVWPALAQLLTVTPSRLGDDDHPGTTQVRPPTEIQVVTIKLVRWFETAKLTFRKLCTLSGIKNAGEQGETVSRGR